MDFQLSIKDINFLRPFFWYLNIFLITPWYDFSKKSLVKTNIRVVYTISVILFKITAVTYSLVDQTLGQAYAKLIFTQRIILGTIYVNTMLTVMVTIFKCGIWATNLWTEMFAGFRFVDRKLQNQGKRESFQRNFYWKLLLKHVFFGTVVYYQIYVWSNFVAMPVWKMVIFSGCMEICYEFLVVLLLTALVQAFEVRYKDLNERLMDVSKKAAIFDELQSLVKAYRILGETVEIFNELFGHQLVLIIFHCGLQMVHCLNLLFASGNIEMDEDTHFQFLISNFWFLVWILYTFLTIVLPISSTNREAGRFIDLLYKMQEERMEKSDMCDFLTRLVNYSKNFHKGFTAAEFFGLNKTVIFSLLGNVATYVIITIQLNNDTRNQQLITSFNVSQFRR
ncbi:hypothetical protein Zmor_019952 [Zophobas morio]|uniref:Gustatory receptor n=1 Tax=Zophobas morio TaxID=2755281 RepID=A0AA38I6R7_9CUCU|nr:hypothetical protein Zmor_019952 [Zophobas morio]